MLSFIPDDVKAYVAAHSTPEPDYHSELAEETRRNTNSPQMMVGHIEGLLLRALVRATAARRVLEIGTFTGYSALAMAAGLPDDGVVITCDVDPDATAIARKHWARSPHGGKIDLRLGPALETIESLDDPLDLVFIDADKERYVDYWEAVVPKVRDGGLIVTDNVLWSGRVLDPREPEAKAIAAFNDLVVRDDRVEVVMLPVRDGVSLAVKLPAAGER
jgi:caffeoyl-CoA O-methyltransferase